MCALSPLMPLNAGANCSIGDTAGYAWVVMVLTLIIHVCPRFQLFLM